MSTIDTALQNLNITLPPAPKPVASYVPYVKTGNLVFVSGQIAMRDGKIQIAGPIPSAQSIEQGQQAARICLINALAVLKDACGGEGGGLDRVARIVRIGVFVQSNDGFDQQAKVANGASDLLIAIFGDAGRHARAAVGTNALPLNTTVEIELLAELKT
ncbi:MAG: RidA family protein [Phycisphaerales bacterium]|nr:RidA family protein [Phycisphaerales bacterium]